jgi:3-dehydroquinate dehydratase/shikimate dehydrogenase
MICISISQESRRLALADMLNASRQCDLLEIRLDRFGKAPEIHDLLSARPKPVIMSCRRPQDGGEWDGTESERQAILRQCIMAKADYVEIELDVADQLRAFPGTKRVISYTNLQETPDDIAEIYNEALKKNPDVVKLTTLARTPEEAWPLLQIVAKASVPTVIVGLGKPGVMLAVLGKKVGAPWTYAALEKGMEAHPEQPTVTDLRKIYHYEEIGKGTRFVGVTGLTYREDVTVAVFNAAFAHLALPFRCLPLVVGNVRLFRKVMDSVKLAAVVVGEEDQTDLFDVAGQVDSTAAQTRAVELLVLKNDTWHGFNHSHKGAIEALETTLRARTGKTEPLHGKIAAIVGTNWLARSLAERLTDLGVGLIIASSDKAKAQQLAVLSKCRFTQLEGIYTMAHDVLIVCEDPKQPVRSGLKGSEGIHPSYLKSSMAVMDLTAGTKKSELLREAEKRGCAVVPPRQLFLSNLHRQVRLLTGQDVPMEPMAVMFNSLMPEDDG